MDTESSLPMFLWLSPWVQDSGYHQGDTPGFGLSLGWKVTKRPKEEPFMQERTTDPPTEEVADLGRPCPLGITSRCPD